MKDHGNLNAQTLLELLKRRTEMSEALTRYEQEQYDKLLLVVDAAKQNKGFYTDIRLQTSGSDPSASATISATILEKIIKR